MSHKLVNVGPLNKAILGFFILAVASAVATEDPSIHELHKSLNAYQGQDMMQIASLYKELAEQKIIWEQEKDTAIVGEKGGQVVPEDDNTQFVKTIEGLGSTFFFTGLAELGDKTFIMVVIFTNKINNIQLFIWVMAGLALMHSLGSLFGGLFQLFLSQYILTIISTGAFFIFGIALIYFGLTEEEDDFDTKQQEVQKEVNESFSHYSVDDIEEGKKRSGCERFIGNLLSHSGVKLFLMVMMSEMGDRSQITAVALAATYKVWLVIVGGILGHAVAMLLAILAGQLIGRKVSENTITVIGGVLFLIFSAYELIFDVLQNDQA